MINLNVCIKHSERFWSPDYLLQHPTLKNDPFLTQNEKRAIPLSLFIKRFCDRVCRRNNRLMMTGLLFVASLVLLSLCSVEGNNSDQFNYRGTAGRDFGPEDWNQVTCDNPGQCVSLFLS